MSLPHENPLSVNQMASLAHHLARREPRTVLEVGCGAGSFSIELARACDASITAVDINPRFLERARAAAATESLRGRVEFLEQAASSIPSHKFDAVICIGASHAFGTCVEALGRCTAFLKPDGVVLFADLVWSTEPPGEFLDFLGTPISTHWLESEGANVFGEAGLAVSHQETASPDSWKSFEASVLQARLEFADTLGAAEAQKVRGKALAWAEAYEKFGRHCFGFAAYIASASSV